MEVVSFSRQRKVLDAEILGNDVHGFRAILGIELKPFQARSDEREHFGRMVANFIFRRANATGRITV